MPSGRNSQPSISKPGAVAEAATSQAAHGTAPKSERATTQRERAGYAEASAAETGSAAAPTAGDGLEPVSHAALPEDLTESDLANIQSIRKDAVASNTYKTYASQWRIFTNWAQDKHVPALPADAAQVATYLAERFEKHGHKPATLRVAAASIAFAHRAAGLDDPCAASEVKTTLKGITRKAGRSQKQAEALTAEAFALIQSAAQNPRPRRGGIHESAQTTLSRGNVDIALIGLMRDAMLRVSEVAALTWQDIQTAPDGTGRLLIRRSKTDPEGRGAVAFVSAPTIAALALIRVGAPDSDSMFGLHPNHISRRIKQAAQAAGLGDGFSGHSPRVGMARDLVRAGIELPSLMIAGRWSTPTMPALYARNETASRGAVAQFYGSLRPGS